MDEAITRWRDAMSAEDKSVRTIESYAAKVGECQKWAGWMVVGDVTYESATAFLASRKRNDHDGIAWENGAVRHCVSALRHLGKFLAAAGLTPFDPMTNLTLPKRRPQRHKHPFTEQEARGLVGASMARMARDKRGKGHAALVWATLFWTGLRHGELQAPSKDNKYGGMKWRDINLDGEFPGIWTDPKWLGNKSKTRDWIPLHPRLVDLLKAHRSTVVSTPEAPVFPIWPVRATWVDDRARAQLPAYDDEGRALSVHSTRATFITWLGKLSLPEGLVSRLARHNLTLAERVYTTRDRAEMAQAVVKLPDIWPDLGGNGPKKALNPETGPEVPCLPDPIGYSDVAAGYENAPPHNRNERARPSGSGPQGFGGGDSSESRGRPVLVRVDGEPDSRSETLISDRELDRETLRSTLISLNLLVQGLASRGSIQEPANGRPESKPA